MTNEPEDGREAITQPVIVGGTEQTITEQYAEQQQVCEGYTSFATTQETVYAHAEGYWHALCLPAPQEDTWLREPTGDAAGESESE